MFKQKLFKCGFSTHSLYVRNSVDYETGKFSRVEPGVEIRGDDRGQTGER